jgi:DNA-binding NtrC family response regulator
MDLKSPISAQTGKSDFILGISPAIQPINAVVADIARTNIPVLLSGESGTGKEAYARFIYNLAGNPSKLFKKINCAAWGAQDFREQIPGIIITSGENVKSSGTTVFLDQIDDMDGQCQRALLPLLPDAETNYGDPKPTIRLIAATSRDLEPEMAAGRFRRDLYFRINGVSLRLPPLRERKEDLPALLEHFLTDWAKQLEKARPETSRETIEFLLAHSWPGNIRELRNLSRMMVVLGSAQLAIRELRRTPGNEMPLSGEVKIPSLKIAARTASRHTERELILKTLERTRWNRKLAAQELQISYKSLLYKLKRIETSYPESVEKV